MMETGEILVGANFLGAKAGERVLIWHPQALGGRIFSGRSIFPEDW
jgi:hypothetical protein